jgi:nicotinate dehydrogenase subunit B
MTYFVEPERYELYESPASLFSLDRRDFFRVVGTGLVVVCLLDELPAQQESGGGRRRGFGFGNRPAEISAWLHIGADELVTVYTGKVEIGQNVRTSLAQGVAEELRVPVTSIHMVMADTERVPFDMGTFGSISTPMMFPQLRRAAAAAREVLLDLAAKQWKMDGSRLTAANGKITDAAGKQSLTYGQLTEGKKLLKAIGNDVALTPANQWKVAGTSVPKLDAEGLVTGAHRYSTDVARPGMVHGKVLRPPAFHASLASLDSSPAGNLSGVTVVRDGDFVGVTAPSTHAAEQALARIRAEWKTQEQPSDRDLYQHLKVHATTGGGRGGRGNREQGSIEKGMSEAAHRLETTYTVAYIAHVPLEPRAAVAEWSGDKLTVWTGTQRPFGVRSELMEAFHLPADKVHVIVPDTGSGYGGKHTGEAAVEAARLAKAAGKPVKLVWTREEEFTWAYFRPAGVIEVKSGVRQDGTLCAWAFDNYNSGGSAIDTPYAVANRRIAFHPAQSPLRQGSYRCLAATANHFARECHMDELAHAVGMDPLEFRRKNLKNDRLRGVLEAAAKGFGWGQAKPAADHGFGIAGGTEKGSYVAACAEVAVDRPSGRVHVVRVVTAFDCGAVVNPEHLKNQIEGATIMGLGGALFEAIQFADGRILNPRLSSYRVPRFRDVPMLETVLVDRKDLPSAGAGETPIAAIAPAVGNALFAATGVRIRSMPMAPNGLKS